MRRTLIASTLAAALAASSVPADAFAEGESGIHASGGLLDTSTHERYQQISIFGVLSGYSGIGIAGRYVLPIVRDGFIPSLNDSVELEFGADLWYGWGWGSYYYGYNYGYAGYLGVAPVVEGTWTFHFFPKFDAYAKLGGGLSIRTNGYGVGFFPVGTAGINYRFGDKIALRAEIGYHLRVGLSFLF